MPDPPPSEPPRSHPHPGERSDVHVVPPLTSRTPDPRVRRGWRRHLWRVPHSVESDSWTLAPLDLEGGPCGTSWIPAGGPAQGTRSARRGTTGRRGGAGSGDRHGVDLHPAAPGPDRPRAAARGRRAWRRLSCSPRGSGSLSWRPSWLSTGGPVSCRGRWCPHKAVRGH